MPNASNDVATVLSQVDDWPVDTAAIGVTTADEVVATHGPVARRFPLASVTKPLAAVGVLLAVQHGDIHLDEPAGPEGSTVRHLLSHASGLPMNEGGRGTDVGHRRLYSNVGFDLLGDVVAQRVGTTFADHLSCELLSPLGMVDTSLDGSPAHAATSTVTDLLAFARELLRADLLDDAVWSELAQVQFPELAGIVPGYGRQTPCPWGLGMELRGTKSPHWTGPNQPPEVFGHFGQSGTWLWVDRTAGVAVVALTDRDFGDWAVQTWAPFNDGLASTLGATV